MVLPGRKFVPLYCRYGAFGFVGAFRTCGSLPYEPNYYNGHDNEKNKHGNNSQKHCDTSTLTSSTVRSDIFALFRHMVT